MADVTNVKLGVCTVSFDGTDLGHTKGGVEVNYEPIWHDVTVDQYGESKVDKRLMGENITAKVPLAEATIANLLIAMPGASSAASGARLESGKSAGSKASASAAELVLTPVDATGAEDTITIHKAIAGNQITLAHINDGERVIEVEFEGLIDESNTNGNLLFSIGDPAAS